MSPLSEVVRRRLDIIAPTASGSSAKPPSDAHSSADGTATTAAPTNPLALVAPSHVASPVGVTGSAPSHTRLHTAAEGSDAQARSGLSSNATDSLAPWRHVDEPQAPLIAQSRGSDTSSATAAPVIAAPSPARSPAPEIPLQQPGQLNHGLPSRSMRRKQPEVQAARQGTASAPATGKRLRGALGAVSAALAAHSAETIAGMGFSAAESPTGPSASSSVAAEFAANAKEALKWIQRTEQGNDRYAALLSGNREFARLQGGTTSGCFMFKVSYPRFGKRTVAGGDWRSAGDNHEDTVKIFPVAVVQHISQGFLGSGSVSAGELAEV